ncbi:hypothetical protein [Pasteuria penetrans]|nr:hypothetical protein [Pasteuria penetrans]
MPIPFPGAAQVGLLLYAQRAGAIDGPIDLESTNHEVGFMLRV